MIDPVGTNRPPYWNGFPASAFHPLIRETGWNPDQRGMSIQEGQAMQKIVPTLSSLDHVRGNPSSANTLIEYGDYQCPHCAAAEPIVLEVLRRHHRNLAHAFRHYPLVSIHPMAEPAAETAEFAATHDAFWAMHSGLMACSARLSLSTMFDLAKLLGLSVTRLRYALASGACAARVRRDLALGMSSGVRGTPTFFINGEYYGGPVTVAALDAAIRRAGDRVAMAPTILSQQAGIG